jgi:hypothetical protein
MDRDGILIVPASCGYIDMQKGCTIMWNEIIFRLYIYIAIEDLAPMRSLLDLFINAYPQFLNFFLLLDGNPYGN